jgi:hypothetical protein
LQISSDFSIESDPSHVFDIFLDPKVMRQCIPGCTDLERIDDLHYQGGLTNEVAHVKFSARFAAEIVELDRPNRIKAVLSGEDRRLGSSIKVTISLDLKPRDTGCDVDYQMEIALWGKLGRLGESIIRRRTSEVERDFVSAVVRACNESQAQISVGELSAVLSPSPLPDEAQRLKVDQFAVNGNTDSVGFLVRVWRLVNRFRRKK